MKPNINNCMKSRELDECDFEEPQLQVMILLKLESFKNNSVQSLIIWYTSNHDFFPMSREMEGINCYTK